MSNQYGYGGPPGVLPPPQAAPWQTGPPAQRQQQYPGQWAQPYYGGPGQFGTFTPPKRRSGCLILMFVAVGALVLVAVGLVAAILLVGESTDGPNARPGDGTTIPVPTSEPEKGSAEDIILHNPIYTAGALAQLNCPAEPLGDGSLPAQKRYYEKLFGCLKEGWKPALERAGYTPQDPGLVVFDQPVSTPCGNFKPQSGRVLAFFCYGNKVMYADVLQMNKAFGPKEDLAYLMTIAHEYGHYIQGESSLFYARAVLATERPEQKLDLSRKTELQASCFAGVFSKAVAQSYPLTARLDEFEYQASNSFGDAPNTPDNERTHGQATNQGFWIMNGFNVGETKACNTFAAEGEKVG